MLYALVATFCDSVDISGIFKFSLSVRVIGGMLSSNEDINSMSMPKIELRLLENSSEALLMVGYC